MHKPAEEILQFIWQHRLLKAVDMCSASGTRIRIVTPGILNRDAGPDFFNATLQIGEIVISGNVEIHVRTSDWIRHKHTGDRAYDQIILHAVYDHDCEIPQNTHHHVEVLELRPIIEEGILARYSSFAGRPESIPCSRQLAGVNDMVFSAWLERMAVERLEQKSARIDQFVRGFHGDHNQAFYTVFLQAFGFKVNSAPFELLGRLLPLQILLRHSDNPAALEALLLGVAGLLDEQHPDKYIQKLQNEFVFLQRKYRLYKLREGSLKFSRMRPANFPGIRLAQVAAIVHGHPGLFSDPLKDRSYDELAQILKTNVSPFWKHHYDPAGAYVENELRMGTQAAESIMINVLSPFFFYCGRKFGKEKLVLAATNLLEACAADDNRRTRLFPAKKHLVNSAFQSQGLLNLADRYCDLKKCLHCAAGTQIVAGKSVAAQPATH